MFVCVFIALEQSHARKRQLAQPPCFYDLCADFIKYLRTCGIRAFVRCVRCGACRPHRNMGKSIRVCVCVSWRRLFNLTLLRACIWASVCVYVQ